MSLELLSACLVAEVCQASKVFLLQKEPLSMALELSTHYAFFAMVDTLAHVLTFLICSFLRVLKYRVMSSKNSC